MTIKPVSRKTDIVVQELENEVLIYDLNANKAFCLNESSAIIWQECDGTKTIAEISQAVGRKLNSNISEEFIWLALEQFRKDNLISNDFAGTFESVFAGQTRREVIRKVALASVVALPVVASLTAPTSVYAQSCIPFSSSCSPTSVCCPGSICNSSVCGCMCSAPGDCITQSSCPNDKNCNASMVCAP